jgi:hypothetical protein
MTLRKALWALPLTVSVAVLAHLATFGFLHAPGAGHSAVLLGALGVMLGLALLGTFAGGLVARTRPIATERRFGYAPLLLAAAGAATFGLIELSEGHLAFAAVLQAAIASVPIAYLVAFTARSARHAAHEAGVLCARIASHSDRSHALSVATRVRGGRRVRFASSLVRGTSRGRAPPLPI